jgi:cell division protein FtsL
MLDAESGGVEQSKSPKRKHASIIFDTWLGKWFIQRLTALLVWYWFLLRFLNQPLPFGLYLPREYLLIPAGAALLLMLVFGRWLRFFFYPFYVFFFPLLVLWALFRLFAKMVNIPIQAGHFARSGRLILVLLIVAFAAWLSAFTAESTSIQVVASLLAHSATFILFLYTFRWASNPYRPLTKAVEFFSQQGSELIGKSLVEPTLEDQVQFRTSAKFICEKILVAIDFLYPPESPRERGIAGFTYNQLVPTTIFSFIVIYAVLALSFAFTLDKIEKAWGQQFTGLGSNPTIGDYIYFTFLSQATAVPDGVYPLTTLGQVWLVWMVLTGILLLTLLIATFTTAVGVYSENAVETIGQTLAHEKQRYSEWLNLLSETAADESPVDEDTVLEGDFKQIESPEDNR